MKPLLLAATLLAAVAFTACGDSEEAGNPDSRLTPRQAAEPIPGAAPPLAAVRAQANRILEGGTAAFEDRLAELKGMPVVVNKWASWCAPCRTEFPFFQAQALERGDRIAFLGILANDSEDAGAGFLEQLPLPYPSYFDPGQEIAELIEAPQEFPATAFFDRRGELAFTHKGQYTDEADLAADIDRFALGHQR